MNDPAACKGLDPRLRGEDGMRRGLSAAFYRVIARRIAPKQPRGSSTLVRVSPLGCFAALAMTKIYCRSHVPREGGDPLGQLAPE